MIVVTVGTNEQPFDRLVRGAAMLDASGGLLVQHGASQVPHGAGEWEAFLSFEELEVRMRAADAVVCHAGVGSIMLARQCGHRPIVVPRRAHLREAVDDHQLPLAERLAADGLVTLVEDPETLAAVLQGAPSVQAALPGGTTEPLLGAASLAADVRSVLAGFGTRAAA